MREKPVEKMTYGELVVYANECEKLVEENRNLKCQLRIMQQKYEDMWYENKLQQTTIVKYRRLIEHYEDGAPNYVATQ